MPKGWTCQRVTAGQKCGRWNSSRSKKCIGCGKLRPPRKRPAHLKALENDYEHFVELNGGEFCAICLRPPSPTRRLDRDHSHSTGKARGLLCHFCNRWLPERATPEWLRKAADYLEQREAA